MRSSKQPLPEARQQDPTVPLRKPSKQRIQRHPKRRICPLTDEDSTLHLVAKIGSAQAKTIRCSGTHDLHAYIPQPVSKIVPNPDNGLGVAKRANAAANCKKTARKRSVC
eukprot:GHVN01007577.1.p2 GENE.GHVN01007577.1~~GHVN01007577.1.p2  ORF type:complete len:110 (+),score=4.50 GHVN01007577.1:124-453(+)